MPSSIRELLAEADSLRLDAAALRRVSQVLQRAEGKVISIHTDRSPIGGIPESARLDVSTMLATLCADFLKRADAIDARVQLVDLR